MSLVTSIGTGGTNSRATTAEEANALATDILTAGVIGSTTSTSGVAPTTGGYSINAQGTPDMTVAVGTGVLYTTATPTGGNSQKVRTKNSASANVTISANATGGTRYDWLYLKIDPDKLANSNSGGTDIGTLVTSRSTSATTDNGTPPTYGTLLAVITVANGASSIVNGNITDKRVNATSGINSASSFFAIYDFVESGCVWSGDAYASTLAASMTSGYVWISGVRLTVPAVSARAFTASKDTYVDLSDNGDGTAAINYTEATNNAASPALSAGRVRVAIIVSGASNIAAVGSVNQGQETKVLPIASSIPYAVTDSLGNLICPRDPQRKLLGYKQITSNATSTQTSANASSQITGLSCPVIIPAGRKVKITLFSEAVYSNAGGVSAKTTIWTGTVGSGTQLSQSAHLGPATTAASPTTTTAITTSLTASTTFNGSLFVASAATATFEAASTYPAFIMVELV